MNECMLKGQKKVHDLMIPYQHDRFFLMENDNSNNDDASHRRRRRRRRPVEGC